MCTSVFLKSSATLPLELLITRTDQTVSTMPPTMTITAPFLFLCFPAVLPQGSHSRYSRLGCRNKRLFLYITTNNNNNFWRLAVSPIWETERSASSLNNHSLSLNTPKCPCALSDRVVPFQYFVYLFFPLFLRANFAAMERNASAKPCERETK